MYFSKTPSVIKPLYRDFIWEIPTKEKVIYLTFDDGPIPEITPRVLSTLNTFNAKATFFCVGNNVEKHPDIYQQILAEGHYTGNHTYCHLNGWKTKDEDYFEDVRKCEPLITSNLFRPPYGRIKKSQVQYLKKQYHLIMWDVLSGDFDNSISPEKCLKNAISYTQEGSIIVFHDSVKAAGNMQYALPKFLQHFSEKGFQFKALTPGVIRQHAAQ